MKVLDLFSGIGGFSLGLERAGMETVAFCEQDESCQKVLEKHWPDTVILNDVSEVYYGDGVLSQEETFSTVGIDVVCGGFPCQDISTANTTGKGLQGKRSGLWSEMRRIINEVKPKYCIIENVPNLRNRGLGRIIKDLSEIGYMGRADVISARAFGASHQRERLFIIATHSDNYGFIGKAYAESTKDSKRNWEDNRGAKRPFMQGAEWPVEPDVGRVVHGISDWSHEDRKRRKERIKQLGNAVVPQITEWIGRQIMEWEDE